MASGEKVSDTNIIQGLKEEAFRDYVTIYEDALKEATDIEESQEEVELKEKPKSIKKSVSKKKSKHRSEAPVEEPLCRNCSTKRSHEAEMCQDCDKPMDKCMCGPEPSH